MPSIYTVIGIAWLVSLVGTGWYCYDWGDESATNKSRAAHATALEETIKQARADAVIDMQAAVEAEQARQQVRIVYRERAAKIGESLNANPLPRECKLADATVSLFNDAIRDANGAKATSKPLPMPPASLPSNRPNAGTNTRVSLDY